MLFHEENALLFCMHCQKETPHELHYVNQSISTIECEYCKNRLSIDVDAMNEFHHYVGERLVSKPERMTEEARQNLSKFLASLPMRIISKPLRFGTEYNQMNKEVKEFMEIHQEEIEEDDK